MSDDNTIDLNSPDIQAAIAAAVEAQVQGLKAKNDELLGKLTKTKGEFDGLKSQFADVDLEQYRSFKAKLQEDETTKLIAEGKIDEVLNQRVQALKQDYEGKLSQTAQQAELYKSKVLNGYIATAAAQAGVDKSAIDLVSLLAQQEGVRLDERGNPVIVDSEGNVRYSKDGNTPLSLNDWLNGLQESKPLLWGQPQGAGSRGGQGGQMDENPNDWSEARKIELFQTNRPEYNRIFKS